MIAASKSSNKLLGLSRIIVLPVTRLAVASLLSKLLQSRHCSFQLIVFKFDEGLCLPWVTHRFKRFSLVAALIVVSVVSWSSLRERTPTLPGWVGAIVVGAGKSIGWTGVETEGDEVMLKK